MRVRPLVFITVAILAFSGFAAPVSAAAHSAAPAASTAALTAENNDGVKSGGPGAHDYYCLTLNSGINADVCFQPYGDVLYVDDLNGDGNSALMYWENWQANSSGNWVLARYGRCYNRLGAANGWAACNKDFYEDTTSPNGEGGVGSFIRFWVCEVNEGCSSNYRDILNYQ